MTYRMPPEMAEATRLTRLGQLTEATALIQKLLRGEGTSATASQSSGPIIDAEVVSPEVTPPNRVLQDAPSRSTKSGRQRTNLREAVRYLAALAKSRGFDAGLAKRVPPQPLPEGAAFETAAYSNAAGTRNYKLYSPSNRGSEPLPLIVMLHGCTQSPDDFAAGTRMNMLAEEHKFLVAYPAQNSQANAKHCWNWFKPGDQRRGEGEPSLIAGITAQIIKDHGADPERVYIAGLSAGGAAAAIMAEAYSDIYAAAGVHSGLPSGAAADLPSAFDAMRVGAAVKARSAKTVPAIIFHGDKDLVVNPRNGEAVVAQAQQAAAGLRQKTEHGLASGGHSYSRTIFADPEERTVCEYWRIHEAGHAWSGGSPAGSYTDPKGPDASREMVRFFLQHRRR
jgi:poly(hydroxyalkanoate) depolymerase family esterase